MLVTFTLLDGFPFLFATSVCIDIRRVWASMLAPCYLFIAIVVLMNLLDGNFDDLRSKHGSLVGPCPQGVLSEVPWLVFACPFSTCWKLFWIRFGTNFVQILPLDRGFPGRKIAEASVKDSNTIPTWPRAEYCRRQLGSAFFCLFSLGPRGNWDLRAVLRTLVCLDPWRSPQPKERSYHGHGTNKE